MLFLALCFAVCSIASAQLPPHSIPPHQSTFQRKQWKQVHIEAKILSKTALPSIYHFLSSPKIKTELHNCCSHLLTSSTINNATALYSLLAAEMQVSELVHNFDARASKNNPTGDVNLDQANEFQFFPNEWQLEYLNLLDDFGGSKSPEDSAETGMFGCAEFTGTNYTPGNWNEASDRLVYTAINTRKIASGNPNFGDITVVFKKDYLQDMALLFPLDSGIFEMTCNSSGPHKNFFPAFNCSALPQPTNMLATLDHTNHMFLPSLFYWNRTWGIEAPLGTLGTRSMDGFTKNMYNTHDVPNVPVSAAHQLATVVQRLLSPWSNMPNVSSGETMMYQEANILGTAMLPAAVKFIIGDFTSLFGTTYGVKLQQWCLTNSWVLVWTLGPNQPPRKKHSHHDPNVPWSSNQRIVDPQVIHVANASSIVSKMDQDMFGELWQTVSKRRATKILPKIITVQEWKELWSKMPMDLAVEPLRANLCSVPHQCIGALVKDGSCVCYQNEGDNKEKVTVQ